MNVGTFMAIVACRTIDPRIPTTSGRSTSGFHRRGRHCLHQPRGGGCTHIMHGCNRMTIDPRIPTMPGRSTSGFPRPGGGGLIIMHGRSRMTRRGGAGYSIPCMDGSRWTIDPGIPTMPGRSTSSVHLEFLPGGVILQQWCIT